MFRGTTTGTSLKPSPTMRVFVDTSAFYALADRSNRLHRSAVRAYEKLVEQAQLLTTDHVLLECWFLISHRLGREAALKFWDALFSGIVELIPVGSADLRTARQIMAAFPDQGFSLVDATSFAVMERLGVTRAFTFDDRFRVYRFGKGRERSFEVIP
jgi:predicted nucleic acid-binding protein